MNETDSDGRPLAASAGAGESIGQAGEIRSARIESLRAIAALSVLGSHVFGVSRSFGPGVADTWLHRALYGGGFGVFLFFGLTGYLLFWPFARRFFDDAGPIDLGRYALNRALRILPLYYVVAAVCLILLQNGGSFTQWWRFSVFSENFFASTVGKVDGPMWSVVVEIHFYILLPFLAAGLAWVVGRSRKRAALALSALALPALVLHWVLVAHPSATPDVRWRYAIVTSFFFFVSGMLLALLRLSWQERRPAWVRGRVASADVWLLASVPLWALAFYHYQFTEVLALASFLMIGACVLPLREGPLVRVLEWRPLATVGVASYSLYLWHFPIVTELGNHVTRNGVALAALAVPLCLIVAGASYALIERPFLSLRRRWTRATPTSAQPATPSVPAPAEA